MFIGYFITNDAGWWRCWLGSKIASPVLSSPTNLLSTEKAFFPPSSPGFKSLNCRDFFSILLSWWTVLRSNPSSAKKWISQMQLGVTSRATNYKKRTFFQNGGQHRNKKRRFLGINPIFFLATKNTCFEHEIGNDEDWLKLER